MAAPLDTIREFPKLAPGAMVDDRHGIIAGSLLSAVAGYLWLRWTLPAVR